MLKDHLASRQNVVQMPRDTLNAKLSAIETTFGEAWLLQAGPHPVRDLWHRVDTLATNELLNLGDALERFSADSPDWLAGQVAKIMEGDPGEIAGAIFEVLALNLFTPETCRVDPAPKSMPGFDGTLHLGDGSRMLLSIKNHGISTPERAFQMESRETDRAFTEALSNHGLQDAELNVIAKRHLTTGDFARLRADVPECLGDIKAGRLGDLLDRPYAIVIRELGDQYGPLSPLTSSSACRIIVPIAPNEQANFEDAIRKGCANLAKHTAGQTGGDLCRMILLRLSNTASLAKCREWADWHFAEFPDDPVDLIVLYQCTVTVDETTNTSAITHHVLTINGPRFPQWQVREDCGTRELPRMSVLVGRISATPPTLQLRGEGLAPLTLDGHYFYQRADIYVPAAVAEGSIGELSNPAPGMLVHAVIDDGGVARTISMITARDKELVLLP